MTEYEIGQLLRERRKSLNLTLDEVANEIGVSKSTASRWETGNIQNIKRSHIYRLAQILHLPISAILGIDNNEPIEDAALIVARNKLIEEIQGIKNINDIDNIETYIHAFITKK